MSTKAKTSKTSDAPESKKRKQVSDDVKEKPASKKAKVVSKSKSNSSSSSKSASKIVASKSKANAALKTKETKASAGKVKVLNKLERLEEARKAFKWWESEPLPDGVNWRCMEHPGVVFAPAYKPHGVPLIYGGKEIILNSEQEELASFFAAIPVDGPQLGNPATREVFVKNFFLGFKETLPADSVIQKFDDCDFSKIKAHLDLKKNLQKVVTGEEKESKKAAKDQVMLQYAYGLIDGRLEKLGNYNIEPPGLFRGRGEHPKTGCIKERTLAESIHLNLSEDSAVPKCTLPGHAWLSVRHDPAVTWLCSWSENVQGQTKYVMLSASSSFKGKSDQDKYLTAIQLKSCIGKVRRDYEEKIRSSDRADKQLGTAMWVIDKLALRVGGEKGEEEADTYGCCSLLKEHLKFNTDESAMEIELEFLGKDSMLYKQNIEFRRYGEIGELVFGCLRSFCSGKRPTDEVFETLTPPLLNKHLNSLMPGLTAKVFRTYNASVTLELELPSADDLKGLNVQEKVLRYNAANRQVAILCNHQKTVSKATESMFENLNEKLSVLVRQRDELKEWLALSKKGKENKIPRKEDDKDIIEKLQLKLQKAIDKKEKAVSTEEKLHSASELDLVKAEIKKDANRRLLEKHLFKITPSADSIKSRVEKWEEDIKKLEADIRNKDENKEVALGTSKINYMDPRISVAWCKRCEVPIDKIFAKTLREKFNWAMAVPPSWKFDLSHQSAMQLSKSRTEDHASEEEDSDDDA